MKDTEYLKRGNLLWESSRMFLPEHREQLLSHRRRKREYVQPELDEDCRSELDAALLDAFASGRTVVITYGGQYEPERIRGRVARIDTMTSQLRVETDSGAVQLPFRSVLHIEWDR